MTDSRYAPPAASVADPPPVILQRPAAVAGAAWLLGATYLVSVVGTLHQYWVAFGGIPSGMLIYLFVGAAIGIGISIWFITAVWHGRNWARVLLIVLLCLKVAMSFKFVPLMPRLGALYNATYLVGFGMLGVAVALMFTRDARAWFAPRRQATG
jgi:hypothetical protein